ncbi:hypothetical protein H2509_20550 [Stappia sp. F7233]|uniref:Uncharacterized protein n=1 Tax=Stappia albiluteola TaxID=2758565 RepID=A0A839AKH1_9HYPH|nr:hypothetical protein [Stappia albiluteola]MBA5779528.1 hypothetical protein [Stappia albiluteola]
MYYGICVLASLLVGWMAQIGKKQIGVLWGAITLSTLLVVHALTGSHFQNFYYQWGIDQTFSLHVAQYFFGVVVPTAILVLAVASLPER